MPRNYSHPSRNRDAIQATQDRALHLRETTNLTLRQIAVECGYINPTTGEPRPSTATESIRAARLRRDGRATRIATTAVQTVANRVSGSLPSNRTFGIEAEFFGITRDTAKRALASVGIASTIAGRQQTVPNWKLTTDGSVTSIGTGEGIGLELVSPILRGWAGMEEAMKALKALTDAGAKVDSSCGLHIHLGADGMNGADLMRVVDLYTANTASIRQLVANSRVNSQWCRDWTPSTINSSDIRNIRTLNTNRDLRQAVAHTGRYHTVNLEAYTKHGTIEFRQHQGTLNGKKLLNWVKFVMALTEFSNANPNAGAFTDLNAMLTGIGLDSESVNYLGNRASQLAVRR